MNTLTVMEEERIRAALDDLRRSDTPTNWYRYRHSMTTSLVDSHRYSSVIQVVVCIRIQERDRARWRWRGYVDDAPADGDSDGDGDGDGDDRPHTREHSRRIGRAQDAAR